MAITAVTTEAEDNNIPPGSIDPSNNPSSHLLYKYYFLISFFFSVASSVFYTSNLASTLLPVEARDGSLRWLLAAPVDLDACIGPSSSI